MAKNVTGKRFASALKSNGLSQTALAKVLGVDPSTVSRWCTGRERPDAKFRPAIREAVGMAETEWLTSSEVAEQESLLARARGAA